MNIQDVSTAVEHRKALKEQKKFLQAATKRQGKHLKHRTIRVNAVEEHEIRCYRMARMAGGHVLHTSFILPPYQPSVAPLENLEKIYLKDLGLETHHRGSYALLRTVTSALRMTGISVIVEDETKAVEKMQIYNQEDEHFRPAQLIVPKESICIVKEPYLMSTSKNTYGIRIDHVSDLVWLDEDDERVPLSWRPRITEAEEDPEEVALVGDTALKAGEYVVALKYYTTALKCQHTDEQAQTIRANRSMANLHLGRYDDALCDAEWTTERLKRSQQGLWCAGRAYYELAKFQQSNDNFTALLTEYPDDELAKVELFRTQQRLNELEYGQYDFPKMYEAAENNPPLVDCATYIGPVVVKDTNGRGRGLFTTKSVKAGELLFCEKAFACCYATDSSSATSSKTGLLINVVTNQITMGTQGSLITAIVQRLSRNPSLIPAFNVLYHGSYKSTNIFEVDNAPVVDTFRVEQAISHNGFGCPITSLSIHFVPQSPSATTMTEPLSKSYQSCGVWLLASSINHSCLANVRRSFIGDMQIVRATQNIPADTELTFWYVVPQLSGYEKMKEGLRNWGFECTCYLCTEEKITNKKVLKKRDDLFGDLKAEFDMNVNVKEDKVERLTAAMSKTYISPATQAPRLQAWDSHLALTRSHAAHKLPTKTIPTALNALAALGFVITSAPLPIPTDREEPPLEVQQWGLVFDQVVEVWIHLWIAYASVAPAGVSVVKECAMIAYKMCIGEDVTFDEKIGDRVTKLIEDGATVGSTP